MLNNKKVNISMITNLRGVIGVNGGMSWPPSRKEFSTFLDEVAGHVILQGVKTNKQHGGWPNCRNVVLSDTFKPKQNYEVVKTLGEAADMAENELKVFGGNSVYLPALEYVDNLNINVRLENDVTGDVLMPWLNEEMVNADVDYLISTLFTYFKNNNMHQGTTWKCATKKEILILEDGCRLAQVYIEKQ